MVYDIESLDNIDENGQIRSVRLEEPIELRVEMAPTATERRHFEARMSRIGFAFETMSQQGADRTTWRVHRLPWIVYRRLNKHECLRLLSSIAENQLGNKHGVRKTCSDEPSWAYIPVELADLFNMEACRSI